jgi:thiol-disulfide isomerase/thioredoxin
VWLTFGAPWCQPCRAENPDVEATYRKYQGQGLQLVAVFIQDSAADVEEYAQRTGLTYTKIVDSSGAIANNYRIDGIPTHFFIDSSGILREIKISSLNPTSMGEALSQIGVKVAGSAE